LSELRRAAGPEYDGPLCEALDGALSTLLLEALLATKFHLYEGSHILLALRVTLAAFTGRPEACAVWDAIVSLEEEGASLGADTSAAVSSAAAGPKAKDQLFTVFAELVNCWGMIMLGRWPRALLGECSSSVEAALVQSAVEPPSAGDAGGTEASEAASPPASVVVGMSGSALARVVRGLFQASRRAVGCAVEEAELDSTSRRRTRGLGLKVTISQSQPRSQILLSLEGCGSDARAMLCNAIRFCFCFSDDSLGILAHCSYTLLIQS